MIEVGDFLRVEMRVGQIIEVDNIAQTRDPAYQLKIDFGSKIGVKKTSAQITVNYKMQDLIDRRVIAVVNFPPKQIGTFMSDVLVLGVADKNDNIVLLTPDKDTPLGARVV